MQVYSIKDVTASFNISSLFGWALNSLFLIIFFFFKQTVHLGSYNAKLQFKPINQNWSIFPQCNLNKLAFGLSFWCVCGGGAELSSVVTMLARCGLQCQGIFSWALWRPAVSFHNYTPHIYLQLLLLLVITLFPSLSRQCEAWTLGEKKEGHWCAEIGEECFNSWC